MADRNAIARDKLMDEIALKKQQKAMREFAQALSTGQAAMLDRFGVQVTKDNLIMYHQPYDLVFVVEDVIPILDPRMPPGLVHVKLSCTTDLQIAVNQRSMTVIACGQRENAETSVLTPPAGEVGAAPPSEEAPPGALDETPEAIADRLAALRGAEDPPDGGTGDQ